MFSAFPTFPSKTSKQPQTISITSNYSHRQACVIPHQKHKRKLNTKIKYKLKIILYVEVLIYLNYMQTFHQETPKVRYICMVKYFPYCFVMQVVHACLGLRVLALQVMSLFHNYYKDFLSLMLILVKDRRHLGFTLLTHLSSIIFFNVTYWLKTTLTFLVLPFLFSLILLQFLEECSAHPSCETFGSIENIFG